MLKEQHDSIDFSHYTQGSGRFIIPKEYAQQFKADKPSFELWVVKSKEELFALQDGGEFENNKRFPFLILIPFEEVKE